MSSLNHSINKLTEKNLNVKIWKNIQVQVLNKICIQHFEKIQIRIEKFHFDPQPQNFVIFKTRLFVKFSTDFNT